MAAAGTGAIRRFGAGGFIAWTGLAGATMRCADKVLDNRGAVDTGRLNGGRDCTALGTDGEYPRGVFSVWRCVCVAGRLYLDGSIS
jgi:hypothetical protein